MAGLTNISLARGAPSPDIVAVEELKGAAQRAFERDPAGAVAYGTSAGYPRLLEWLAKKHGVAPDRLLATNGSMQADAFLFQELVEPGDVVVVEAPTYDRTLLSLTKLGAEVFPIPLEADGLDVGALEVALDAGARPKLAHRLEALVHPPYTRVASISFAISATWVGLRATRTPFPSSASAFAAAVPLEPDTIAPAWPIVLPGGAVKPAM